MSRQDYHLTQPCSSEEKQTNKNSAQISLYTKLTQTIELTSGGQKPKGRKKNGKKRKTPQNCKSPMYTQKLITTPKSVTEYTDIHIHLWAKS